MCEAVETLAVSNHLMVEAIAMSVCGEPRSQRLLSNYSRADISAPCSSRKLKKLRSVSTEPAASKCRVANRLLAICKKFAPIGPHAKVGHAAASQGCPPGPPQHISQAGFGHDHS